MGKAKQPKAPDPYVVAAAQTKSNKDTAAHQAALNRIDQTSPFGSSNYSMTGTDPTTGAPIYSQSTTLSPELQGLFDSQIGSQKGVSDAITGAIGRLPNSPFDASGINTSDIAQKSYDRQVANLTPQFAEGWRNLESTMSDRGLPIGSEIWNNERNRFDKARGDSLTAASRTAEMDALGEHQRQYGNALGEYNLPLQQLSALMGNSQAVGSPQFAGVPGVQTAGTDVSGNVWNAYKAQSDAANQSNSNLFGGLLGVGKLGLGAASMFSDVRMKEDIRPVGALADGQTVYSYRYKGRPEYHIGLMAQEVEQYEPSAVGETGGMKTVHYGIATAKAADMLAAR